ncbi:hypothetical protein EUTSA_v10009513mg [Eutrema salsugineum]|uniref:Uncharacterized protein n=1 Tax=Eutrema salsugineum TaxID=72664 RepID=V4K8M8_EUTSA|nr:protein SPEAR4 [Eutrema salsugineum]ESQ33975.1 hypothetical protein EUTSA_v10009513mg [Eutrema salsugineum]
MCSKTSSGRRYGDDDYSGLCPKKQKHNPNNNNNNGRRRVPRRGPGVAELEKIRLEEQHKSPSLQLPSPPPPPPPEKPPSAFLPTSTERTGPVFPFSSYFSTGSFPDDLIPPAPVFQRNHYLPPMNLSSPGSGGFYQFIEPPLNQTSRLNNVSQFLDEEKMVAAKRPWHYIAETTTKCSVGPTITISRDDGRQIKPLDHQRLKNHFHDSGNTIRNPITIDSPSPATPIIRNSSLDFPLFVQKEDFDHEFLPRKTGANFPSNRKPFYSFLPASEQSTRDQDLSFSLRTDRYDTVTDHGIDLRLKL